MSKLKEMSFLDHLEALRWMLIKCTVAVIIAGSIAFMFSSFIFDTVLFASLNPDFVTYEWLCETSKKLSFDEELCVSEIKMNIINREMSGQFSVHIWTSFTAGIILAFPLILWFFWNFISPALYRNEKKYAVGFMLSTSILFMLGVLFGYFVVVPMSVNFLANYYVSSLIKNEIDITSIISLVRSACIASGLLFLLPIIIYFLTKLGLVTPQFLRKYRKYTLIIILLLAAIITPPDVISQIIVTIPIMILYELSIFISSFVHKRNQKKQGLKSKTN